MTTTHPPAKRVRPRSQPLRLMKDNLTILAGNCLDVLPTLPDESVQTCVTSPPYWGLRDYGSNGQIGLEDTPDDYVGNLVDVFRDVRRVLKHDGTLWLNLGDSYDAKNLVGVPWRVAFALQADGWYLRQDIIWAKPNPMPESVTDRCTKAHEYIFLLCKSARYFYDAESINEPLSTEPHAPGNIKLDQSRNDMDRMIEVWGSSGRRNRRSVWTVPTSPYPESHFATFPPDLIKPCILAGTRTAGKRCDCSEVINTPVGSGPIDDPTMQTGRSGMNRPRRDNEGRRPITKREQRSDAVQLAKSPHRTEIENLCGSAFEHYIRTDDSGARPLPENIRFDLLRRGWLSPATPCDCAVSPADVVLDPFAGSFTTCAVALELGRRAIGIELNPQYVELGRQRCAVVTPGLPLA